MDTNRKPQRLMRAGKRTVSVTSAYQSAVADTPGDQPAQPGPTARRRSNHRPYRDSPKHITQYTAAMKR